VFKFFKAAAKPAPPPRRKTTPARPVTAADAVALRSPPSPADLRLSEAAVGWCAALPPAERPTALCERYPRIANRLALVWPDAELTSRYFDSLIIDRRGGRQGFPPEVMAELIRLRAFRVRIVAPAPRAATASLQMKGVDFDLS
jgi:hypothetical protein